METKSKNNELYGLSDIASMLKCSRSKVKTLWSQGQLVFVQSIDGHCKRYSTVAHINDYLKKVFPGVDVRIIDGVMQVKR